MARNPDNTITPDDPRLLIREVELAARWQISRRTLQRWRARGAGPAYIVIVGAIRYRLEDVMAYEEKMRRERGAP